MKGASGRRLFCVWQVYGTLARPGVELGQDICERQAACGRPDDRDEQVIANRIAEYEQKTAPLKDYYGAQGKYKGINGVGSIADITARLVEAIG